MDLGPTLRRSIGVLIGMAALGGTPAVSVGSTPSLESLRAASFEFLKRGDFVRALRVAYLARERSPTGPNASFLLGVIFDEGLDRPDLAIPEYEKAISLRPWSDLPDRLRERVHYLRRRSVEKAAAGEDSDMGTPLGGAEVAVYPFELFGPPVPNPSLFLGLLDLLVDDLALSGAAEALHLHLAHHSYPGGAQPDAVAFARGCGAARILTGSIAHLGGGDLQVRVRSIGSDGETHYESPALTVSIRDLAELHRVLLTQGYKAVGRQTPTSLPDLDIRSPITLTLYGRALQDYLDGKLDAAMAGFEEVSQMEPRSKLAKRRRASTRLDAGGIAVSGSLLDAYRTALKQPNTNRALLNRLRATQRLSGMGSDAASGDEPLKPYKPPRTTP